MVLILYLFQNQFLFKTQTLKWKKTNPQKKQKQK